MNCQLPAKDILDAINKARSRYMRGTLNAEVLNSTKKEFWIFQPNSADENKKQLLQIAKSNQSKPHYRKHPLGRALSCYVVESSKIYDPKFTQQLKKIRPEWFEISIEKRKKQLLQLAKSGSDRPNTRKHPLGYNLSSYTSSKSTIYDAEFTKKIKLLAPHWFRTTDQNKKKLIQIAKSGKPRPHITKHPLGHALNYYIRKSSGSFDNKFAVEIKKLAPHWFVSQSEIAHQKKQQLIQMAKNGENKPQPKKHPLAHVFRSYIYPRLTTYDAQFTQKIKKIAPHWFRN